MLITYDFVFRFEYEDDIALLRSAYGLNWPEKVITKKHFRLKNNTFLSIYPNGSKPKGILDHFESFMLGFILLNRVDQNRNDTIETSSTLVGLVKQTCLAMVKVLELSPTLFFEDIDEIESDDQLDDGDFEKIPKKNTSVICGNWVENGINIMDDLMRNGWIFFEEFDPTLIGEELIEGQNDFIIKPTSMFLEHLDDFEIEQF